MHNKILRLFSSIPIILISLYFLPLLGICLLILRLFMYKEKRSSTVIVLIFFALLLLVFKFIEVFLTKQKQNLTLGSWFDIDLTMYYKQLIIAGTACLIVVTAFEKIKDAVKNKILKQINKYEEENREIREKNDLIMQEKREKAKNTTFVSCPYCGGDNILTGPTGTCKFCRRTLESKNSNK